jgi:hypothetical protein
MQSFPNWEIITHNPRWRPVLNKTISPYRFFLLLVLLMSLTLAACGGSAAETPPTDTPPPPTNTPVPPTQTPAPTSTPVPTATPDVTAGFVPFASPEDGIFLSYPSDWLTQGFFGFFLFASNEELLDAPEPGEEGGLVLVIANDTAEFETTDPDEAVDMAVSELGLGDNTEIVSGPEAITVHGLSGSKALIRATTENGTPIAALVAILIGPERGVMFFGVTPQESEPEFLPIFAAMLQTLELRTPEARSGINLVDADGILSYGELVDGSVLNAGETAVYAFSGSKGDLVSLTFTPLTEGFDLVINLLDATGASLVGGEQDNSFGEETLSNVLLPVDGQYFITIAGYGGSVGDFQLLLKTEGLAYPSSGSVIVGKTVLSTVTAAGAAEWTFTAAAGDVVDIIVTPLDDLDAVVDVLSASGKSVLPNGEVDDAFGVEELRGVVIPVAGTYTIAVRGFAGGTGSFSLLVRPGSGAQTPPAGEIIAYGETGSGALTGTSTQSWSFFAEKGDIVDVTVIPLNDDLDVVVDVLDSFGFSILENGEQDQSFNTEYIRVLFIEEEGFYTVAVRGFSGSTGSYEVLVDESLGRLPGSIIFAADTMEEGEEHAFPFTADAGETVRIYVWPDFGTDVMVSLYNDDTDELIDEVDNTTGYEELVFTATELANYYFQVSGFEGSTGYYEVAIVATELAYVEVTVGDEVYGRLSPDGPLEYFISGVRGDVLTISLSSDEEVDIVITLLDLDDNVLAEVDEAFSGGEEVLTYTFTSDMMVIISIRDYFSNVGKFSMVINLE